MGKKNTNDLRENTFYQKIQVGNKFIDGRFVIPSGIRCTKAAVIKAVFESMPSVGIITTKSISYNPKKGYREPIYAEYAANCYMNAVGLDNPGAELFKNELISVNIPDNKFLLVSIFGATAEEFWAAAKILEQAADGFELNMSCPHAKGYGLEIGHDPNFVAEITETVVKVTKKPVFVKLSATVTNAGESARAAIKAGAYGIVTTNTVGPGMELIDGRPVLFNKVGGISGAGIRPLGLKSIYNIRNAIDPEIPIIGLGGISSAKHVEDFYAAGSDFFGIGSALTGMDSDEMRIYLHALQNDLLFEKSDCSKFFSDKRKMEYVECTLVNKILIKDNLFKIEIKDNHGQLNKHQVAGKFFFIMVPEIGEKPFAMFSSEEKSFLIGVKGVFTEYLNELTEGAKLYLRGPYGKELPVLANKHIHLVGGGVGISPLYEIAKKYGPANHIHFYLGGQSKEDICELDKFRQLGEVHVATEDGSLGLKGTVVDLFANLANPQDGDTYYINCGPEKMVLKCFELQHQHTAREKIFGSIEYYTSCGVGVCGKCATPAGDLSCVDGPFMPLDRFYNCSCRKAQK